MGSCRRLAALQFASVDAVTFDDNGGHLYVEMRVNAAGISARNIPFITTNMVVNTVPGDLFKEQFYFLDAEPESRQDGSERIEWEADVGEFDPVNNPPRLMQSKATALRNRATRPVHIQTGWTDNRRRASTSLVSG